MTTELLPNGETLQPVELSVRVTSLSNRIVTWNNYATVHYPWDDKESGHSWNDYIIECSVQITDESKDLGYKLNRLVLYDQTSTHYGGGRGQLSYEQMVRALSSSQPVRIRIDREAIKKRALSKIGTGFMGEDDSYYWEEDEKGGEGYSNDPKLMALRAEIRGLNTQEFTPESEAVNLEFVQILSEPTQSVGKEGL